MYLLDQCMESYPTSHMKISKMTGNEAAVPAIIQLVLLLKERTNQKWMVINMTQSKTRAMGSEMIRQVFTKKGPFPCPRIPEASGCNAMSTGQGPVRKVPVNRGLPA